MDGKPNRPLDRFELWMVARNLEYVKSEGAEVVAARLRSRGYNRVGDAVELKAKKNDDRET